MHNIMPRGLLGGGVSDLQYVPLRPVQLAVFVCGSLSSSELSSLDSFELSDDKGKLLAIDLKSSFSEHSDSSSRPEIPN